MKNKIKLMGFIFLFVTLLSITGLTVYATGENNQFEINPDTYGSTIKIEKVWNDNDNKTGNRPDKIDIKYKYTYTNEKKHLGQPVVTEEEIEETISLTKENNWTTIIETPAKGFGGVLNKDVKLIIEEVSVPEGYSVSYDMEEYLPLPNDVDASDYILTITNTYKEEIDDNLEDAKLINVNINSETSIDELFSNIDIPPSISWRVEDESIAKIENGKIVALKAGTTTIIGTGDNISLRIDVVVNPETVEVPNTLQTVTTYTIIGIITALIGVAVILKVIDLKKQKVN